MNTGMITLSQARQITGGRKPLVPVQYEEACKALAACVDLDDAKLWSDKADALAAWAKIYRDNTISRKAKQLKLRAYRRMGELAAEIRPMRRLKRGYGSTPGPRSLLMEQGLSKPAANAATRLSRLTKNKFEEIANKPTPPSPIIAMNQYGGKKRSDAWLHFSQGPNGAMHFRGFCRKNNPAKLAQGFSASEAKQARELVIEIQEWLDTFEHHLTK